MRLPEKILIEDCRTVSPATDLREPSQAPADLSLWSRPGYLVRRLHQIHSALWAEECRDFAITPVQYALLTALLQVPGSDQATLGTEVGIDRTNVADVLERLAERGLIRRRRSARDRRMMLAELTPEGETLTREMHGAMRRTQERLLAPLACRDRDRLMAMLATLLDGNNDYAHGTPGVESSGGKSRKRPPVATDG